MIHVNTNFLIDALVPGSLQEAQLVAWLAAGESLTGGGCSWAWDGVRPAFGMLEPSDRAV